MTLPVSFFTVAGYGEDILYIQRSRFICRANHIQSEEEASQWIQSIRKENHDATHHCYAYIIHPHQKKSSDDGEPSGTAGRPILEVIEHHHLSQIAVVITRYFGGKKLGTGGLVRAYQQAAHLAIEQAEIIKKEPHRELICQVNYSLWGKMEHYIHSSNYQIDPPIFTSDSVRFSLWIPMEQEKSVKKQLSQWFQGKIHIQNGSIKHLTVT